MNKHIGFALLAAALTGAYACGSSGTSNSHDGGTTTKRDAGAADAGQIGNEPDAGTTTSYGTLASVSFTTPFIFDYSKLTDQASGQTYQQAHQNGFQQSAAFTGSYTAAATPIPPVGTTLAYAAYAPASGGDPAMLFVGQQTQSSSSVLSPIVQLYFASADVATGALPVGLGDSDLAQLYVIDATTNCFAAVGVGTLNVTTATNTGAEGGSLAFSGSDVALFHPTDTPYGDISSQITGAGATICPK